jgi:hypothetical protein
LASPRALASALPSAGALIACVRWRRGDPKRRAVRTDDSRADSRFAVLPSAGALIVYLG